MQIDVFNGDADGIIALLQLRLAKPLASQLVTGVKRNIGLLNDIEASRGDTITVLDISMEKNQSALLCLLASGAEVFYVDHHRCGQIPEFDNLQAHIDLDANSCTALIVDDLLAGQFHDWAICAAFGDNLITHATQLSEQAGHSPKETASLQTLGTLINYNGYGESLTDLHYHPAKLYRLLLSYRSPFDLIDDLNSPFYQLQAGYQADMERALDQTVYYQSNCLSVFILGKEKWAKRISGVYSNLLANQTPDKAHLVLTQNDDASYLVSLRAPLNNKQGAGDICSLFTTGGGRAAAAGINCLEKEQLNRLIETVELHYC